MKKNWLDTFLNSKYKKEILIGSISAIFDFLLLLGVFLNDFIITLVGIMLYSVLIASIMVYYEMKLKEKDKNGKM